MKNLFMLLLFIATTSIYAQNNLKGTVTDADNQTAVPFASIYFPALEKGSQTDVDGHFSIAGIPNGRHQLIISAIGFKSFSQTMSFPSETTLSVALIHAAIEMDEVIVSTPFHKLQSE